MKVYNVANKDETAFYSSGYASRYEAEELLRISKQHDPDAHVVEYEVKTALEKMDEERAELLARIPRWNNAKESPPARWHMGDKDKTLINYLVYSPDYGVDVGNYIKPAKQWVCMGLPMRVTHWMPLPEPPKEETP